MNIETGRIITPEAFAALEERERAKHREIQRPLTVKEERRMKIDSYSPCGCGSGKKFKFCCYLKRSGAVTTPHQALPTATS